MRSRLEARWGVFFDALGLAWEYEKEGFTLEGDVRYLPDFWLSELNMWVEVKGQEPTNDELIKGLLLSKATGHPVALLWGAIPLPDPGEVFRDIEEILQELKDGTYICPPYPSYGSYCLEYDKTGEGIASQFYTLDCQYLPMNCAYFTVGNAWLQCPQCGSIGFADWLYKSRMPCDCIPVGRESFDLLIDRTPDLLTAYRAARQARFEFGKHGN